jgi:transposase-like protein
MSGRVICRYSEAFKLTVVSELESGKLGNIGEAMRRYGITGKTTVRQWLRKYGKTQYLPRVIRVETPDERDRLKELQKENDRLKKTLAETHMKAVLYESWFEIACREFGVTDIETFKKKLDGRS